MGKEFGQRESGCRSTLFDQSGHGESAAASVRIADVWPVERCREASKDIERVLTIMRVPWSLLEPGFVELYCRGVRVASAGKEGHLTSHRALKMLSFD